MAKKTRRKKSAKGRIRRSEEVTPERLMERSFAYASPVIIGAGVSNKVFGSLKDGAKTSPYVPSATAPRGWRVPVLHVKTQRRAGLSSAKTLFASFPAIADTARAKRLANALCFNGNFVPSIPVPILVGGVKQFSVASTIVEANLRNKSPISSSSSRYSAVVSTTVLGIPMR